MKKEVLYKYRGLSNLKRFLEIILNKKTLWCPIHRTE